MALARSELSLEDQGFSQPLYCLGFVAEMLYLLILGYNLHLCLSTLSWELFPLF